MNKSDIIRAVSKKTNFTLDNSAIAVDAILEAIGEGLSKGEKITLQGVCSFVPIVRAARVGRNPKTGEKIDIPAKNAYKFNLAPVIKDAINK